MYYYLSKSKLDIFSHTIFLQENPQYVSIVWIKFLCVFTIRQSRYIPGDDEGVGGGGGDLGVRDHLRGTLLSGDIGWFTQSTPS